MKKQRVSPACTFVGAGKNFVLVSGGYGAGKRVLNECEVFNVNDNFWTVIPSMNEHRASHSLLQVDNQKYVYAFGGLNE